MEAMGVINKTSLKFIAGFLAIIFAGIVSLAVIKGFK